VKKNTDLAYLYQKPKVIAWKRIVGPELDYCQMHDLVFDNYDYQIRQLTYKQVLAGNQI
jgi:hypothetical protein